MEPGQYLTALPGFFDAVFEGVPGDEFEKLVEVVAERDDGGLAVASGDKLGQRKFGGGEQALDAVGQMDAFGMGANCRSALEQEFPAIADDADLGALAGAAREIGDGLENAEIVIA